MKSIDISKAWFAIAKARKNKGDVEGARRATENARISRGRAGLRKKFMPFYER